jgi:hypothetical protein
LTRRTSHVRYAMPDMLPMIISVLS